ncbi:hypothetical protein LSTR_LSTR011851 [Laodelphax striatellus]|uniref:Uncharacterized protein n=1 Tax=Laodelphax striatellus TaxID=195883 RepID=A0A482XNM8_LAOST|nr:hypothetical protein LSTR_LSTR011851 [Laodelphax striatellus]
MTEINENVTPLKTSTECVDRGLFKFQNGDCYLGCFTANNKRELYREGFGKYFCNRPNGESYCGLWKKDNLISAKSITYKNKHTYKGELSNMRMVGEGIYTIPSIGDLHIVFEDNKPTDEIDLIDVNGYCWKGQCENDGVILYPLNHFKIFRKDSIIKRHSETKIQADAD